MKKKNSETNSSTVTLYESKLQLVYCFTYEYRAVKISLQNKTSYPNVSFFFIAT